MSFSCRIQKSLHKWYKMSIISACPCREHIGKFDFTQGTVEHSRDTFQCDIFMNLTNFNRRIYFKNAFAIENIRLYTENQSRTPFC